MINQTYHNNGKRSTREPISKLFLDNGLHALLINKAQDKYSNTYSTFNCKLTMVKYRELGFTDH